MNFIPTPSITDFLFLVGLEHTVDYLTNEDRMPRSSVPAVCAQCGCDFTPVWRWERPPARRLDATFTPPHPPAPARRLCELCVSGNVKRALKVSCGEVLLPAAKRPPQSAAEPPPQCAAKPPPQFAAKPPPQPAAMPPPKPAVKPLLQPADKPPPQPAAMPPPQLVAKPTPQAAAPRPLSSPDSLGSRRSERARESSDVPAKKGKSSSSTSQENSKHDQMSKDQTTNDLPLSAFLDELVDGDWSESSGESGMEVSGGSASEAEIDDLPSMSPETTLHESEGQKWLAGAGSGEGRRMRGRRGGGRGIGSRGGRGRGRGNAAGRGRGSRARAVKGSSGWRQDLRIEGDENENEFQDAVNFEAQEFGGDRGAKESEWSSMATFSGSIELPNPGPTVRFSRPYEAFRFYWNDDILEHIVRETNRYAAELKSSTVRFARDWYETNLHETMILFAFWMMLGLIRMPTIKSCFSTNPLLKTGIFRTLMTEARYCYLNRALHFVDNATRTPDSSKLFPLGPLVGHLNAKFQEASADCNTSMGVNKKDQMEPLLIERKKRKYHKKMFKRLLSASVLNSCMLLDKTSSDPVKTQDFRLKLVDEIIENHLEHVPKPCVKETANQDASLPPERLTGRQHFISRQEVDGDLLTTARTSIGRMSCMWCTVIEKRRSRTVWKCKTCDVPLCLEGCFEKFHTLA